MQKHPFPQGLFLCAFVTAALFYGAGVPFARASTTDGTISATNKYAWGNIAGWLNFGNSNGNVHVTDTALTGYAWSENYGWIHLAPSGSGVTNNSEGTLGGSAWSEQLGYVSFSGVTINSSGVFAGTATGTVAGTVTFDCANCAVSTDWRPASARASSGSSSSGTGGSGGGSGGLSSQAQEPPAPPLAVLINGGAPRTESRFVNLTLVAGSNVTEMTVSNRPDFLYDYQEAFQNTRMWDVCSSGGVSFSVCSEGVYAVYVKYFTAWGRSAVVSSTIIYERAPAPSPTATVVPPVAQVSEIFPSVSIGKAIQDILSALLPSLFKPEPVPALPPAIVFVPRIPQAVFAPAWNLLPVDAIREFVFAPLPEQIRVFIAKFPSFQKTLSEVGVLRESDVQKLLNVTLVVPGIGEAVGAVTPDEIAFPRAVPVALFEPAEKQKLPNEVLFVRSVGEKFDVNVNVRLADTGKLESYITTIVGAPLHLVVKPEGNPTRVHGYFVFDSRTPGNAKRVSELPNVLGDRLFQSYPAANQAAAISAVMYQNAFGAESPAPAGNRLVLMEFDYRDENRDGIYTADVIAPVVDGTYEIITRAEYREEGRIASSKEFKLIAVIDPEGYVYELSGGKETRIPNAMVTLYARNSETETYGAWPAEAYNQRNPQVTDQRGTYAFLSPEGSYYLRVEAPGYLPQQTDPFELRAGSSGVHMNIELQPRWGFLSRVDWKTIAILVVLMLLAFNFYRDRMRAKMLGG